MLRQGLSGYKQIWSYLETFIAIASSLYVNMNTGTETDEIDRVVEKPKEYLLHTPRLFNHFNHLLGISSTN